jgi:predicted DNA-binding transcriptional regulator AlpA
MTLADAPAALDTEQAGPTLDEVRGWPATVDVGRACRALGYSRSWGYALIAAGEFPVRVITTRGRSRVVTSSLLALLDAGET